MRATTELEAVSRDETLARRIAEAPTTNAQLIDEAAAAERRGNSGDAWAIRQAVAIRIVDWPNER